MEAAAGELTYDTLVEEECLDAIDNYLGGLHCSTWGQHWGIWSPDGRRDAARWLYRQFIGMVDQLDRDVALVPAAHPNGNGKAVPA